MANSRTTRTTRYTGIIFAVLFSFACSYGQDRFDSGDLKGFSRGKGEHIIVELEKPFIVSSVKGHVASDAGDSALNSVLIELRGPGDREMIRSTKTGKDGRFNLHHTPEGSYMFKATLFGFQSVLGHIIVSRRGVKAHDIKVNMPLGV